MVTQKKSIHFNSTAQSFAFRKCKKLGLCPLIMTMIMTPN